MSALIGALRVSLSADTAKFEEGMKRAQRQAHSSSTAISKSMGMLKAGIVGLASGLSVGMLAGAIKGALDYAGSLGEISQQLGVTTRDLQNFRAVAAQNGISTEELDKGLLKLRVTLGQVAVGAKAPAAALEALQKGLSQTIQGKDTGTAFRMIADGLEKVKDSSQRAAVEVALFGRTGAKLDPMLAGGSKAINELAAANEALGGVLSDTQIQNADKTADKLAQLHLVLKTQIAGTVADNADAIIDLANSLVYLVSQIGTALQWWRQFNAEFQGDMAELRGDEAQAARHRGSSYQSGKYPSRAGRSVTVKLGAAEPLPVPAATGGNLGKFLGGGGSKRKPPKGPADTSLRDAHQFDMELRRAGMDILRAQQDLATDYRVRTALSIRMLEAERAAYKATLDYEVAAKEKTEAQAGQLLALYDTKAALEREAIVADDVAQAAEHARDFQAALLDMDRNLLESEAQLAETAAEQREVQLRLLELSYRQERARLEAVLADERASVGAKMEAEMRLARLNESRANDEEAVRRGTRNPLEEWAASIPQSAAQITEALQVIQADGLEGLSDAITDVISGTKGLKEAFGDMARAIMMDIIKMTVRMLIFRAVSGIMGGAMGGGISESGALGDASGVHHDLLGFAKGGAFSVLGRGGTDRNILSINGLPVARVSHGERINVSNDNAGGGMAKVHIVPSPYFNAVVDGRAVAVAVPLAGQAAVSGAAGAGMRMANQQRRQIP